MERIGRMDRIFTGWLVGSLCFNSPVKPAQSCPSGESSPLALTDDNSSSALLSMTWLLWMKEKPLAA
jgi:hypothetical protein